MLAAGKPADEALEYLANTLTNRLLHAPTQALRQAAELADAETVAAKPWRGLITKNATGNKLQGRYNSRP